VHYPEFQGTVSSSGACFAQYTILTPRTVFIKSSKSKSVSLRLNIPGVGGRSDIWVAHDVGPIAVV
jgi:hypothetical protein